MSDFKIPIKFDEITKKEFEAYEEVRVSGKK